MNQAMPSSPRATLLVVLFGLAALLAFAPCLAQAPDQPAAAQQSPKTRPDKAIEHIRTEDSGTRIDELRVGGETQNITVQPKTGKNTPAYEVKPPDGAKGGAPSPSNGDTNGSRVWNVLKF